uniref:ImmA/IrrE family metallo-endopeptidase n=1 Tax=Enterocloster clostridioformis TaxID=1531 RepID=UPI0026EAADA9|nr:ImmA/IrrE family metallo-endopeptidase [Enterocloster clostridioformis]
MSLLDIRGEVAYLKHYYKTKNPFDIIQAKNILLLSEELGLVRGYYNLVLRQKQIHINCNLEGVQRQFTVTHELGHAVMHPKSNTPFLLANTYQSVDKMEIEANKFAVEFLISDDTLYEYLKYQECTIEQTARILGYQKELIELRLK